MSEYLYALSEMLYIYDSEQPSTFGVLRRILQDAGTVLFTTHKTGTVPGMVIMYMLKTEKLDRFFFLYNPF